MLSNLIVIHSSSNFDASGINMPAVFILNTCQRTLLVGEDKTIQSLMEMNIPLPADYELYRGEEAYRFLLQVITGLKSRIIGETEIRCQFKKAYQKYMASRIISPRTSFVIEKLFKDSKVVRTNYLKEVGKYSYAGISRKIVSAIEPSLPVLVLGTGALAKEYISITHRQRNIFVWGRNKERAQYLNQDFGAAVLPHGQQFSNFEEYPVIVNTIGGEFELLGNQFFSNWASKHCERTFIDLGSPSVIETPLSREQKVFRLEDIFQFAERIGKVKNEKLMGAYDSIDKLANQRFTHGTQQRLKGRNFA